MQRGFAHAAQQEGLMHTADIVDPQRRRLLRWLAASPLLAGPSLEAFTQEVTLAAPGEALDVFDFEAAARRVVPPAHWGYLQSGVDGDRTVLANQQAFSRWQLRPRRFVDVSNISLATEVLGTRMASPVLLCPLGSLRAMHPEGEAAAARAAKTRDQLLILSTQASVPIEEVSAARGAPIWFQLYTTNRFEAAVQMLRRAEAAGCTAVAVTIDTPNGRNTVTANRLRREDQRPCRACHTVNDRGNPVAGIATKPMFAGLDTQGLGLVSGSLQWDYVKRLRDATKMKVVLKGIEAGEDAALAVRHGADGIIVSNHGGRALESGRGTVESLGEVVKGAAGKIPVMLDGGVRRGTDVFKALALGASAVGIGRPYVWGLASHGQAGVERVMEILNLELRLAMVGCGARTIAEISPKSLVDTGIVQRG
jgi:isopentenyl diphosphate isomerase/L-lactate dehydrogenase-like FMN-dependent dehydrogenase